jgi:hypothetical protein
MCSTAGVYVDRPVLEGQLVVEWYVLVFEHGDPLSVCLSVCLSVSVQAVADQAVANKV